MPGTVLIIGGGPAGLTAALQLTAHGFLVTLLEAQREIGGQPDPLPSVLMGCHRATLRLLHSLGSGQLLTRPWHATVEWLPSRPGGSPFRLIRPWIPGPLHGLLGLLLLRTLPYRDRWHMLNWIERTLEQDPALPLDLDSRTADEWLAGWDQSQEAREGTWEPLARFLVGEGLTSVSAAVLVSQLTRCFLSARRNSRVTVPPADWRDLLILPATRRLARVGATIRCGAQVTRLLVENQAITGVQLTSGERLRAQFVVTALPHDQLTPLLSEQVLTHFSYFQQLTKLQHVPALTLHLWFKALAKKPRLVLLAKRPFHWLTIRSSPTAPRSHSVVSLVATGNQEILSRADQDLVKLGTDIVEKPLGQPVPKVVDHQIVRAPRALLSVRQGTAALRPLPQSPFANLFVAGDWTDTGFPSTLESAVVSGLRCAKAIMQRS